jgi:hypothetical protein
MVGGVSSQFRADGGVLQAAVMLPVASDRWMRPRAPAERPQTVLTDFAPAVEPATADGTFRAGIHS